MQNTVAAMGSCFFFKAYDNVIAIYEHQRLVVEGYDVGCLFHNVSLKRFCYVRQVIKGNKKTHSLGKDM